MKAWHFLSSDMRLANGDKRKASVYATLHYAGPLKLCQSGLHASARLIDALSHAPGPMLCRVKLGGEIIKGSDKVVASERTVLWALDVSDTLRRFARLCALDVVHLWDAPPVVLRSLRTGDDIDRDATYDEARSVARSAADAAAYDAAYDAAYAATYDAAYDAADAAAWSVARSAANAAARAAARDKQNKRLTRMVLAARRAGGAS